MRLRNSLIGSLSLYFMELDLQGRVKFLTIWSLDGPSTKMTRCPQLEVKVLLTQDPCNSENSVVFSELNYVTASTHTIVQRGVVDLCVI